MLKRRVWTRAPPNLLPFIFTSQARYIALEVVEPAFEVLTHEFFATLHVDLTVGRTRPALIFTIIGNLRSCSLNDLFEVCTFYTKEDSAIDSFWGLITFAFINSAPQSWLQQ